MLQHNNKPLCSEPRCDKEAILVFSDDGEEHGTCGFPHYQTYYSRKYIKLLSAYTADKTPPGGNEAEAVSEKVLWRR